MESESKLLRLNAAPSCNTPNEFLILVCVEKWRLIAYFWFWSMCIFAITITQIYVVSYLANGPEDGSSCGPFNRDNPEFGVYPGKGFEFPSQTHLVMTTGYNNICANWDYSPSRELTAMVYPLFEYSLVVYICLDFMLVLLANQRGKIEAWFWCLTQVFFPILLFLCAQFRMIFVCIAYENVQQHTAGFLGLQVALALVSIQNTAFVWDSNKAYKFLRGRQEGLMRTRFISIVYLILVLIIDGFKMAGSISIVLNGSPAPWTLQDTAIPGMKVIEIVDIIWMIFNAVIPMIFALVCYKFDEPLTITFSQTDTKSLDTGKLV